LKGSYGEAYRAPNFQELYMDLWLFHVDHKLGDVNAKPEELKTAEIGLTHRFNKQLQMNMSAFYTEINDRIIPLDNEYVDDITSPLGYYIIERWGSRAMAQIRGGEAGVRYTKSLLDVSLHYSYQETWDPNNDFRLSYTPRHKAFATAKIDLGRGFSVNTLSYFIVGTQIPDDEFSSSIFVNNLRLNWDVRDDLQLVLSGKNIFDAISEEDIDYLHVGRVLGLEANYKFGF
jgi:vitamin B12 transporter